MRFTTWLATLLICAALTLLVLALGAHVQAVTAAVMGGLCVLLAVPCVIWTRLQAGLDRDHDQVKELQTRGQRVQGKVLDAVPYASVHGGAVFQTGGAQMVLQVALDRGDGRHETVSIHVVEASEASRARIGSEVTIVEHPNEPTLRALSGYMPNGRRA